METKNKSQQGINGDARLLTGRVTWDRLSAPVPNMIVLFEAQDKERSTGRGSTGREGEYRLQVPVSDERTCCMHGTITVQDKKGLILHRSSVEICAGSKESVINIIIPAAKKSYLEKGRLIQRQTIKLGNIELDARELEKLQPEGLLDIARAYVKMERDDKSIKKIMALSPELVINEKYRNGPITLCGTSLLQTLNEIIVYKKWPRDVRLQIEAILSLNAFGYGFASHDCGNFIINYDTTGMAPVNASTAAEDVIDPGSSPAVVLATLPAGGVPTYIKRVCFWLERALASYVNPPFSMLNPAGAGKIQVYINSAPYGSAGTTAFYLNYNLAPDLMCAVAVHELFHMVQFEYGTSGDWSFSMVEGGAVFAEDSAADSMNRYLDEAGTNFNGIGVQDDPNISLESAGYKCSLFWRYIAEQQSAGITAADEPKIGVETYRTLIEKCALAGGTYSTDNIKDAIRQLPWYQDFYEFSYLDAARQDRQSSETAFGNYVLACYLKQLGNNVPDRRFDFMEDEDNIHIDDVIQATIPSSPLQTQLAEVHLSGTGTVGTATPVSFTGSVNKFASQYFEVTIDAALTNVQVNFSGTAGLTSSLFQVVLVDEDNLVRDIHRSDKTTYAKRITNVRDGKRLSKLLLVVSGANTGGSYSISAASAVAAPDVMVTRWHSIIKNEYEIDSRNWAWTWVSPDIWVDNDSNGIADSEVFFNFNNKLTIRLHNKGNQDAAGIQVELFYQDASGGLSDAAWMPVKNMAGINQVLTGLTLAQGASNTFVADWSPMPSGMSHHFCVRAIVTVPGDPNTDNKRVQSNFGNVVAAFGHFADISFVRRNLLETKSDITLQVIPRLGEQYKLALSDIKDNKIKTMKPGEISKDTLRIYHVPKAKNKDRKLDNTHPKPSRYATKPDPLGFYRTPKEALPPGVDPQSLITIVHEANGLAQGGITFQVKAADERRVEKKEK